MNIVWFQISSSYYYTVAFSSSGGKSLRQILHAMKEYEICTLFGSLQSYHLNKRPETISGLQALAFHYLITIWITQEHFFYDIFSSLQIIKKHYYQKGKRRKTRFDRVFCELWKYFKTQVAGFIILKYWVRSVHLNGIECGSIEISLSVRKHEQFNSKFNFTSLHDFRFICLTRRFFKINWILFYGHWTIDWLIHQTIIYW